MSLQEKLFFPGVREGLNTALGISSLEELKQRERITLAPQVFERTRQDIQKTLQTYREHSTRFGIRRGRLAITAEDVGDEFDLLTLSASSQDISLGRYLLGMGRPDVLEFHTHPSFTRDFLLNDLGKNQRTKNTQQSLQVSMTKLNIIMNLEVSLASFNVAEANFSDTDLSVSRKFPRLGLASLLGTEHGYRLIVNPNFKVTLRRGRTKAIKEYEREYKALRLEEVITMRNEGRKTVDIKTFQRKADSLLKKVCDKEGWLLFGNDDYNSPELKRI